MAGILNLFKNIGRSMDAKADAQAEKIASDNATEFGKQDITKMKEERAKIIGNIGSLKGEIMVLKDKAKAMRADIKKHDEDASALAESNEALALQHCDESERITGELESTNEAIKTLEENLSQQESLKAEYDSNIRTAESDLSSLKAMTDAAKATEKLAQVSSDTGGSAISAFKQRKEEAKARLVKAQATKDANSSDSGADLQKATDEALGRSGAAARLAKLKGKAAK